MQFLRSIVALAVLGAATVPGQQPAVLPTSPAAEIPAGAPPAIGFVDRADLLAHAAALAADELAGRLTATPGQEAAADYIAARFAALGLEPLGDAGDDGRRGWLQRYPVTRTSLDAESSLRCGEHRIDRGFAVLAGGDPDTVIEVDGTLALVERGAMPADLDGRIPLLLVKTTSGRGLDVNRQFGFAFPFLQRLGRSVRAAGRAGAEVLVVGLLDDDAAVANVLNYLTVAPGKPRVAPRGDLKRAVDGDQMGMVAAMLAGRLPIVFTGAAATAALLEAMGVDPAAARARVFDEAGAELAPTVAPTAAVRLGMRQEAVDASNVVAVLRGGDEQLGAEAIVFSAHMDHVGMRLDGSVFNGADDNASGSAGLLEIAEAFARSETRPRRSVVFLAVSGEELGLWGSAWYANHPTWEVERIVGNVNTDMIGRGGPDAALGEVMVTPSHRHPKYDTLARTAAELAPAVGLTVVPSDKFFARSDHYNFVKQGIPAVFFCCGGEHDDYHQVTDEVQRLDGAQMERAARLAFWVGWQAANQDDRPQELGRRADWFAEQR